MGFNIYEEVTNRIIAQLEEGKIPWEKPWSGVRNKGAFNRKSKRPYSLLNQMILKHEGEYASFKQWTEMGGKIKKGEKSEMVVFWKIFETEDTLEDGTTYKKTIPYLKYYNVFHISQVEGVEPLEKPQQNNDPIAEAEEVKENYKNRELLDIRERVTNDAFYSPLSDYINVPCINQYENVEEFYSTLFHEMVHSTGHKKRLGRFDESTKLAHFGSEDYSKEELVAEIGSATLMNIVGIETEHSFRNSAGYIQSWLSVLRNDNRFIVSASSKAEKAVKYILGE